MGSEDFYPSEVPVRRVSVEGIWIDPHPVTNDQFKEFVAATGYQTVAEQPPPPELYPGATKEHLVPGALVFTMTQGPVDLRDYHNWWSWTPGARWQNPTGPESSLDSLGTHPVVQVSHRDAVAYCDGPAAVCRPRPNGSLRRGEGWMQNDSRGATTTSRKRSRSRTPGRVGSHMRTSKSTVIRQRRRWVHSLQTDTGYTTPPAMSGSGPTIGTPIGRSVCWKPPLALLANLVARVGRTASISTSPMCPSRVKL